jgi:hypothetical protein
VSGVVLPREIRSRPGKSAGLWAAVTIMLGLSVLTLHLPHYLRESAGIVAYAGFPGLLLVVTAAAASTAAVGVVCRCRWGWWLGIAVAATTFVLYVVQETVGLDGLERSWWEPTRLLAQGCAAGFAALALRSLRSR